MAKVLFSLSVLALVTVALAMPSPQKNGIGAMFDSSSQESSEEDVMQEIGEMCRNNSGSDEAFRKLSEAMQKSMMCAMSAIDVDNLVSDIDTLSKDTRSTFFPRYCPQLRTASSCLKDVVGAAKPCLEDDDFVIVDALSGIIPDAIELICKNDGDILFKMDDPKYKECIDKLGDTMMECITPFAAETDNWDISHLTQDQCGTLFGFRQCVQRKLNVCKAPDLISVYDLFHNTLFRMTPCRNYSGPSKVTEIDNNTINEV